ncbi:ROK family glucokinase [Bacillus sp. FJAT-45350]|uniref:ROK family glucokinase n=1 Tax=Bacillus sp. FJAT-45350 TaxID=2011014 RepID=UPI000BB94B81|nr:ROK family glucokinase [Bacillus sp. FJAT-45350]
MVEQWLAGVDIGGTSIKVAFVNKYGDIIKKWEIRTNTSEEGKFITTEITKSIDKHLDELGETKEKLRGIGLGAPGFINMETGYIYSAVNIGWKEFPLKDRLEVESGLPVIVDNDANIAALGEMWRGAGDGSKNLLCITLGTGVGGGIIANGQIVHGVNGMAGEIGHITAVPKGGIACNCGKTGCIETIASATGLSRMATEGLNGKGTQSILKNVFTQRGRLTSKDIFEAAKQNDQWATEVIDTMAFHLGLVIANLANSLNPEKIVIGGGVSKAGALLLKPLNHYFQQFALSRVSQSFNITIATLGNDAGVIGGAWLAKETFK